VSNFGFSFLENLSLFELFYKGFDLIGHQNEKASTAAKSAWRPYKDTLWRLPSHNAPSEG
jgi:hypothetical protein